MEGSGYKHNGKDIFKFIIFFIVFILFMVRIGRGDERGYEWYETLSLPFIFVWEALRGLIDWLWQWRLVRIIATVACVSIIAKGIEQWIREIIRSEREKDRDNKIDEEEEDYYDDDL